jgi:hypothetical protein
MQRVTLLQRRLHVNIRLEQINCYISKFTFLELDLDCSLMTVKIKSGCNFSLRGYLISRCI